MSSSSVMSMCIASYQSIRATLPGVSKGLFTLLTGAFLVAGTPFAKNLWDYVTAFMPLWDTAHQEGLLEVDRYLSASKPPSSEEAGLNLIHAFNETYDSYWGYWMDYLSPNQWSLDQAGYLYAPDYKEED